MAAVNSRNDSRVETTLPPEPAIRWGRWVVPDPVAVFLASMVAAVLFWLLGPYTNFGAPGYIDPWLYTGYFTHFSYLIDHHGVTYYVSRLPWIIPGLLVFKVASAEAASVILNALITACSVSALYLLVSRHYGRVPGAVAAVALMTNPYFVSAVSWDYPDGPAIAYAFVALACFATPHRGRVPNAVWAGVALALSGCTNFAVMPVLLGALMIPIWRNWRSPLRLLREAGYVFCGGAAATMVLAIAGKLLLNTYSFLTPQIDLVLYTFSHPNYLKDMWGTGNAWIPASYRLFPPLFALFLGGVLLCLRRKKLREVCVETYLCLLVTCVLFAIFEFRFHNVGLRVAYASSYMVAPLLAFAGALLGEVIEAPAAAHDVPPTAGHAIWALVLLGGLYLPYWHAGSTPALPPQKAWAVMSLIALAAALILLLLRFWPRVPARAAFALVLLGGLFLGPASDNALAYVWSAQDGPLFRSMMAIESDVDSELSPRRAVKFWYDSGTPPTNFFHSTYSLYLWGYFDFSKRLATAPVEDLKPILTPRTTLVHLMVNQDQTAERTRLLASRGIVVGNERRHTVQSPFGLIYVVLQDLGADSEIH